MTRLFKQFIFVALLLPISLASLAQIKVGSKAPNFTLSDQNSIQHQLSDYEGSWVILYFYPKDDTPGCTTQACDFRDAVKRIIASKSNVFGVSLDSVESHKRFADKNNLPFSLLSDESGEVSEAYDSLNNFMSFKSAKRNTFIIDPDGKVAKIYLSVKPSTHSQMVLNDLNQLQN
ncbi:alkyl hydroperoxide reductase [Candidatus Pseudothioglobus singularis]|jgi:peroxiredoxin Q/BCP|uniref:thioredoxin-dependent peroxiredoxin n=1 Tax=Candidatus Pseudothioglobus singularis PS1 TaxID=1125411 RepID=A0A0M4LPR1_9GAMM|nr:peroxiredoxin [Candidatus Pseudothioglobus singularis]MDC3268041.1 peroxiredoxin [bacterium]MDG1166670.1 peroxiredoxin [Candidatus Thioglobus sp.]ALE01922.1 alkyl hydroperoxide reductase [Candidatus Pseudothioglobus singularis PS1]ANQ66596.1 alkyl hydroperoxide reductase [Candidatus Pseudothioglobus singularis]MDC0470669.1 peroxiredoxin [Candidatus Pseudothioglobus singularis]|tara:strand:- start:2145 stop:2669 length:525 start_codon:yes stop_codon:yes gene_type:complete